jgi:hypothetical protein
MGRGPAVTIDEARDALDKARGGVRVLYHPAGSKPEEGVLKHVTRFVFVAHRGDHLGAMASSPEDITLIAGGAPLPAETAGPVRRAAEQERPAAAVPVIEAVPVQGVLFAFSAATAAGEGGR